MNECRNNEGWGPIYIEKRDAPNKRNKLIKESIIIYYLLNLKESQIKKI